MSENPKPAVAANGSLDDFYANLQDLVIHQARRLINLNLYNRALLSTLPLALLGGDENGRIQVVNQAAEEILGLPEKSLQGRRLSSLFANGSEEIAKIDHTLASGQPHHLGSENLRLASGKEIVGNLAFQPLTDEEGDICGILLTVEDLTYVHQLHSAFRRYVPPSVSEIIAQDPQCLQLGGEEKNISVLFSDLVGFSGISERYRPREMVTLLSDYFGEMTRQVFACEGTLKEYVGDELMAIFGAPVDQSDHAARACRAALAMNSRLARLRVVWPRQGRPALRARIGINSGRMLVGNLGSPYRFSYGAVGDQVNLASRLEGLNGLYGTEILMGANTAASLGDEFKLREIDSVRVKGRLQTVDIFELIALRDTVLEPSRKQALACYARGLAAYRRRAWTEAAGRFQQALIHWPSDGPSRVMHQRCDSFDRSPPPEDWGGVFVHHTKK